MANWWKKIERIRPQFNLDIDPSTGNFNPSLGLSLGQLNEEDVRAGIQDLFDELTNLGSKVVVGLDEFQQISQLEDKGWLEATVRTHFQKLLNVSFLFTGSRKGFVAASYNLYKSDTI